MSLTLDYIETCSVAKLFEIAREYGVTGTNVWDLKQRLIIEVMRKSGSIVDSSWHTENVKKEKEETVKEDEKRRKILTVFFDETKIIYNTIKSLRKIKEHLRNEDRIVERDDPLIAFINHEWPNLREDFEKMTDILQKKPNCSLLVCGVSGAGKSSFINLLLGDNLLPTSIRSNSSCQVRLTYGEPERAEIVDLESQVQIFDKNEFSTKLSKYLENIKDRGTISCKSATIYLKSLILEGGLDIYDTIGLGETEMFNNELHKELNEITGIIFLLKKNEPLGDKTIGGLSEIIHKLIFNGVPSGSMNFIINMCDLLQKPNEKEDLRNNILGQLQEKFSLNSPEITTFSAKQELDFQKNKVMTTSYRDIIKLIQQLHINSINTNTSKVFSFLSKFVIETIGQINELEKYASSAKSERKEYIFRLRSLESDRKLINQNFKKQNENYLEKEKLICRKKIENHFKKLEVKTIVVNAIVDQQSTLYGMTSNEDIIQEIERLTEEEIIKCFKKFIEDERILKTCCKEMLMFFLKEFVEYQNKKDEIKKEMNRHIENVKIIIEGDITKINFEDLSWLGEQNKIFVQLISPILTPIVKLKDFIKMGFNAWYSSIAGVFNKIDIIKFYKDAGTYIMEKSSSKYSKYVNNSRNIRNLVDCLFIAQEQVAKDFEKYLTEDMNYLEKNIQSLEEDMRNKEKVFATYREIKTHLEKIYEELCQFSLLRLQKDRKHIMNDKLEFLPSSISESDEIKPILKGRNRLVFRGQIQSTECINSSIMIYRNKDGKNWKTLLMEYMKHMDISESSRRSLRKDIMKCFLDIQYHALFFIDDNENRNPTFVVNGVDCTLQYFVDLKRESIYKESPNNDETFYKEICRILRQILTGLSFLHLNGMVHYDITGESIGYSMTYQSIKLTSISLPTKVKIKYNKTSMDYVKKYSHLPVNLLSQNSNHMYSTQSDMYGIGILIYIMWNNIHPFHNLIVSQNIENIKDFAHIMGQTNFFSISSSDAFNQGFAHILYNWSCQCIEGLFTAETFQHHLNTETYYGCVDNTPKNIL